MPGPVQSANRRNKHFGLANPRFTARRNCSGRPPKPKPSSAPSMRSLANMNARPPLGRRMTGCSKVKVRSVTFSGIWKHKCSASSSTRQLTSWPSGAAISACSPSGGRHAPRSTPSGASDGIRRTDKPSGRSVTFDRDERLAADRALRMPLEKNGRLNLIVGVMRWLPPLIRRHPADVREALAEGKSPRNHATCLVVTGKAWR